MNSIGHNFRISLFGESHGKAVGVVIDGTPAGIPLCEEDFAYDLSRRKGGTLGTTSRLESDRPEILSGLYNGHTTGAPIAILFRNESVRSEDYDALRNTPRPGHADWVAGVKFGGWSDPRGGGHFSGRLTVGLVAAGVVAKRLLGEGVNIQADVVELGGESEPNKWQQLLEEAQSAGDSLGGIVECRASGVEAGLGSPFFDSLESTIAHLIFAIPGVRGVEFGDGFGAARMRGSEHNDAIISADGTTATNGAGGINGGLSNGNEILLNVAIKPTSSIAREQQTIDLTTGEPTTISTHGRHDVCIALRAAVVVEAAVAIALADASLTR